MSGGLTISYNEKAHFVDSIIDYKRTGLGTSLFKVAMFCECCQGRTFWFSKMKINKNGCQGLGELAN